MATIHKIDAVVVGAGGAGLYAALELSKRNVPVMVLSKIYPTRSHTGTAQGGICAALGNLEEDHWEWHMFDTVKGGDYLTDQDSAEILAREAVDLVESTDWLHLRAELHCDLAEVVVLSGAGDEAGHSLEHALDLYEEKGDLPDADRVRARLADLEG